MQNRKFFSRLVKQHDYLELPAFGHNKEKLLIYNKNGKKIQVFSKLCERLYFYDVMSLSHVEENQSFEFIL